MTQYPTIPYPPLSSPVDPNATPAPYVPILYHVDADTQRFISPLTWRPPLMAQALPHIRFSAITTFKIKPYSNGVPLIIDTQSLVLVRIADRDRTPVHSTYATASEEGYYTVTLDLVNLPANVSDGQGFIELSINDVVLLSDRCTLGSALWPYDEQPRFPYETIYNVEGGSMVFTSTPSMYQLPPVPSTQSELDLTFTPSGSTVTNKLLFYSEAPSLIINVDGATLKGDYVGPGWYCALMVEEDATITLHLSQLTDLYTESINAVRGFNPILVEDEWPTYGRRDSFYIHATTREARIWTGDEWYPVGSSDYKYAPKSDTLPLPTGTASKGVEEKYAAGDHVHPFSIELTTNHLDTAFTTPTDTRVPSSKLVKDTIDQVKSDLEEEISSLPGEINDTLSTKVDKVDGKELSTNDLTNELMDTLEGSEQKLNKDLNFDTPTNGRYPSTLAVSTALDQVQSDLEEDMTTLAGAINDTLSTKVDKVVGKTLSTNDLTDALVTTINGSEQTSNKATTLSTPDNTKYPSTLAVSTGLSTKVDKVEGKGLSTNDLTNELLGVISGAEQTSNKATTLANPDNTKYPSTLAVSTALDQVQSDLEEEMTTLSGSINDTLSTKVDKVEGKALSTNDLTDELMGVISGAEQQGNKVDTLLNPGAADYPSAIAVNAGLSTKVDKVAGKDLSTNDYTTEEKNKVATIDGKVDKVEGKSLSTNDLTDELVTTINGKVDKVDGKGLSTNDLTDALVTTINGSEQASNKATTLDSPDNTKYPSALAVSTALDGKVDKIDGKSLSTNDLTDELVTTINGKVDRVEGKGLSTNDLTDALVTTINGKVDKVTGKELSTNDLTNELVTTINGSEQTSNKATTLDSPDNTKYPTTLVVSSGLNTKVDKVEGKGLSTNDLTNELVTTISGSEQASNKATTLDSPDNTKYPTTLVVSTALDGKVDKVEGKGLSTNDLTDELIATIDGKVDKVEGKVLSDNNYTTEEKSKVATIQNETLTTINGITAEIEPWSRSRWTITGDCSITLSDDWNITGMESAYILITLKTGATLSVPSTVVFDNYLDQGEGVYGVELINLDGVIHFRWTECYPVASIKFYVTTTAPNQTYTINALGVTASTDVGWGDGSLNTYTGEISRTHVYAAPGTYEVRILPAENIVLLNLQGELVSEVNSVDLKAASNMKYFYLRDLSNAIGAINTIDMVDWPLTRYFFLYDSPLLTFDVNSVHMKGWNPTTFYLHKLINGNTTINTEDMAGWTNIETIDMYNLPTLGGSLDTLDWAGWSNLRSVTLYVLPAAFNVRFHTEDLINIPIASLHLYDYDGRNTVINTVDLATKTMTYFRLYKLPLSVVTVNSADMTLWKPAYLMITDLNQATGVIDMSDLVGWNLTSFGFIGCPLLTFIVDQSAILSWTGLLLLQISNCTFTTQQMDETLYYLYTAAPTRTVTGGIISFGGTSSSSPSGAYEAPDCPVTSDTPGKGIAYALKNDSCSVGFNKWATVTIK